MAETIEPLPTLPASAKLEALLFVAPGAVTTGQLAAALDATPREVEKLLDELEAAYAGRGIRLQRFRGRVQLTTAPEAAPDVERFLGLEATNKLSQAALEALSVIAYQQPVTRPHVDGIRGVNSDSVLKTLLNNGLIEEVGRAEAPGRPILYAVTPEFLQHFGLHSLAELPPLDSDQPALPVEDGAGEPETIELLKT